MAKLILSFTSALFALKTGKLTSEDLETALFYFGCTRDHALNPGSKGETNELTWVSNDESEQMRIHETLVQGVLKAENAGRIVWRTPDESNSFEALNSLLETNGFEQLSFNMFDHPEYNYPAVQMAVRDQGHPLQVIPVG